MAILFRSKHTCEPNKFDISMAFKPNETQPGDFMLMEIIALNDKEPIPVVPGWNYLTHNYSINCSVFIFSKVSDDNGEKYAVIRRKTGINYIRVYSWYSDSKNEIILDKHFINVPSAFKSRRNRKFNIDEYTMEYENDTQTIRLINSDIAVFTFSLQEHINIYRPKLLIPVITEANVINNSVALKWNGVERYAIEVSESDSAWSIVEDAIETNTYTVDSLQPSTNYSFRVYATKDDIVSQPSKVINVRTNDRIIMRSFVKTTSGTINPRIVVAPPDIERGDLLIMQVGYMPDMEIKKLSQGWKLVQEYKSDDVCCNIYYKIATRKEPGSYFVQHDGNKTKKMLLAVASFYSLTSNPVRIENSAIQYNSESTTISFPPVSSEADYSLGIGLSVRNLESSLRLPTESTLMWDMDKNLRTTGIFKGYNHTSLITPDSIKANLGSSVAATIVLVEKEINMLPPSVPMGLKAKCTEGTSIRLS